MKPIYAPDRSKEIDGMCEICQKPLMKRDKEYSRLKFNQVLCFEHSPWNKKLL